MKKLQKYLSEIYRDERGLTTVEYAVAGGLVGAVIVASFTSLGTAIAAKLAGIISAL
ncbi:MAG: Flp family type IVb pilin [Thiolinea sp.]